MLGEYSDIPSTTIDGVGKVIDDSGDSELDDLSVTNLGFLGSNPMSSTCGTVVFWKHNGHNEIQMGGGLYEKIYQGISKKISGFSDELPNKSPKLRARNMALHK